MPIRLPAKLWEWVLLFSPAAVILLSTGYELAFIPRAGRIYAGVDGAVVGVFLAIPLSFIAGWIFTTPQTHWYVRAICFLVMSAGILAVNSAIAFGGCMLVMS